MKKFSIQDNAGKLTAAAFGPLYSACFEEWEVVIKPPWMQQIDVNANKNARLIEQLTGTSDTWLWNGMELSFYSCYFRVSTQQTWGMT